MEQYPGITVIRVPFEETRYINVFLLSGTRSILVDTGIAGTAVGHILPALEQMGLSAPHPAIVVNLHSHADHIGGNAELFAAWKEMVLFAAHVFEVPFIEDHFILARYVYHLDTVPEIRQLMGRTGSSVPISLRLRDGDKLSLGNHEITVLHSPGHTVGNIALWDEDNHILIHGESIMGPAELDEQGSLAANFGRNPLDYRETLLRLNHLDFETLLSSHRPAMNAKEGHAFIQETLHSLERFIQTVKTCLAQASNTSSDLAKCVAERGNYQLGEDLMRQVEAIAKKQTKAALAPPPVSAL